MKRHLIEFELKCIVLIIFHWIVKVLLYTTPRESEDACTLMFHNNSNCVYGICKFTENKSETAACCLAVALNGILQRGLIPERLNGSVHRF